MSLLFALPAIAFPPAPNALIYGIVKDQYGTPLSTPGSQVALLTPAGVEVTATIQPNLAVGINYALEVPMDMGVTPDAYVTNALTTAAPFSLYVVSGTTTNLPLEMASGYSYLSAPARQTRIDLTLGTDSNNDGIPDAWENGFLASLGIHLPLASVHPNTDYAHNGLTLKQEYLLGNYPYSTNNTFNVRLLSANAGAAVLQFTTSVGRSYTAYGSSDLANWTPLNVSVPGTGGTSTVQSYYYASDVHTQQVQVVPPAGAPPFQFFRVLLQ